MSSDEGNKEAVYSAHVRELSEKYHDHGEAAQLEELGYKQELNRNLGMVAVLGLSFAIMAVPFGTSTTFYIALTDGGPVTILYGVSKLE